MLLAFFAVLVAMVLRFWRRLPGWADMTLAMVTLGGFGMNVGWWADVGFVSGAPCPCQAESGRVRVSGSSDSLAR